MNAHLRFALLLSVTTVAGGAARSEPPVWTSTSTGADGALVVDDAATLVVQLPPDGILNYTTVTVGANAFLYFKRNADNTPVYLLAQGDITIAGKIDVSSSGETSNPRENARPTRVSYYADLTWVGGLPGPGGGFGGSAGTGPYGSAGLGPGGGQAADASCAYGSNGAGATDTGGCSCSATDSLEGGAAYAEPGEKTLFGGSGGGASGIGGAGGAGVIMIVSSTRIEFQGGNVFALGVDPGYHGFVESSGGGVVRLAAPTIEGPGGIDVRGRCQREALLCTMDTCGGDGIIEVEAVDFPSATLEMYPGAIYGPLSTPLPWGTVHEERPTLAITMVGARVPSAPVTGHPHRFPTLLIPENEDLTVALTAHNVPLGLTAKVAVNTLGFGRTIVDSTALTGTLATSTATAIIRVPAGTKLGDIEAWIPEIPMPY